MYSALTVITRELYNDRAQSADGDDEKPRKREQTPAVGARRVSLRDARGVGAQIVFALIFGHSLQVGAQARAFHPLDDGWRVRHHVLVAGLPDVDRAGAGREQVVVEIRRANRRSRA